MEKVVASSTSEELARRGALWPMGMASVWCSSNEDVDSALEGAVRLGAMKVLLPLMVGS